MDGLGNINWWGFSPSLDLLDLVHQHAPPEFAPDDQNDNYINILVMCAGDQRHILASLQSKRRLYDADKRRVKVRFYVLEKMLELYARHMLLTSVAIEHSSRTSLQEKTELFLDIYANLLVRSHTSQHVRRRANELIRLITDLDAMAKTPLNVFDLSLLKYKEIDYLESVFKYWRADEADTKWSFPASKCWDTRLRAYFGPRYDSRTNAYDWDFAMKLIDRPHGSIVNNRVYSRWRETGVAFELRDVAYDQPNRTLSSVLVMNDPRNGDKSARRGFFGDIIVGPFISYGINSPNEDLYKKQNDSYRYSSLDVAKSNISRMMESLLELGGVTNFQRFDPLKETTTSKLEEIVEEEPVESGKNVDDYLKIDDEVKIVLLPLNVVDDFAKKSKYDGFFHAVYFGNTAAAGVMMTSPSGGLLSKISQPSGALVVFETAKFMLEMKNEQINGFSERLKQLAGESGLVSINENTRKVDKDKVKIESEDFLAFKFKKS